MSQKRKHELVYVGIKHSVIALDRATGTEVWRTRLPKVRFRMNDFVGLVADGDALLVTYSGELFCLDADTGTIRWHNGLEKMGVGVISVLASSAATSPQPAASPPPTVAQILASRRQASS